MTYILVIVESPAKCKKIENYLGLGYKCMASFGHLRALTDLKSIDIPNNFTPTFSISESKRQQISKLRKAVSGASEVILAADDDREGEAIAWHICQIFNLPVETTKRIIFHEVTQTALQRAIKQATTINMDIVHAQQARQILDLVVGYTLSPILWQKISYNSKAGLSAGRCQTPALRLVYDNQKLINASPGKKVYQTTGYFTSNNLPFSLNHNHDGESAMEKFLEDSVNHDHIYECGKARATTKQPPTPFTTSTLQQMASNELKYSPKDTMRLCQTLYEGGYITYMRTDSKTYSKEFLTSAVKLITSDYGSEYVSKDIDSMSERKVPANKSVKKGTKKKEKGDVSAQEAHEAIRPTKLLNKVLADTVGRRESRLYALIWRNTVESCMEAAKYSGVTAVITAPNEHQYRYSAEQVVFPGWKVVAGYEETNPIFTFLQTLKKKCVVEYKKIVAKVSMKELKTHYTEAKLVQLLEEKGIGRPSTFSSLIDKIQERIYVKKMNVEGKKIKCVDFELENDELSELETERTFGNEKNKLVIQPLGVLVLEFLTKHFDALFQYEYTKHMEDSLDIIAKGGRIWHTLCKECYDEICELSKEIKIRNKENITIDKNHTYMIGKYGPVIKCTMNGETTFKGVREDMDMDKLRKGDYKLEDMIVNKNTKDKLLGEYNGKEVVIKNGKYGKYISCDKINVSVEALEEKDREITIDEAIRLITEKEKGIVEGKPSSIIRKIDDCTSVRRGKYGDYVFYKKPQWKKPKFIKLATFVKKNGKNSYLSCEMDMIKVWLKEEHKIE